MSDATPGSPSKSSRRFWVTVICFAVANLGMWIAYDRFARRGPALLEVSQCAPDNQTQVSGRPHFWWTFNLDVAPGATNDPPPGVVSPPVAGRWTWDNSRTLVFTPDAPLPKATALTLTLLPDRLRTPEGFRLNKPAVTAVHTEPLEVIDVRQASLDDQHRLVLEIRFNDDVLPAEVLGHLSVLGPDDKALVCHSFGDATGHTVRFVTDSIPAPTASGKSAFVKVRLAPGFSGRGGPLGLAEAYERNLPIGSQLAATGARSYFANRGDAVLTLQFNNAIDLNTLRPLVSVEPAVPFTLDRNYSGVELHGAFQPATRYAIRIAKAPAGVSPADCPRPDVLSVYVPDRPSSVWFEHAEGYLGSVGNRTVLAHAVNVNDLHVTVTRIYDNNLVAWRNTRAGTDVFDQPVATRNIKLAAHKNQPQDVRLSLDDLLPAAAPRDGVYLISMDATAPARLVSDDEDRGYGQMQDSALITLSDIGLSAKQGRTAVTVWATSLSTARPLGHVRVRLYSNKNQFLGQAFTQADGLASIAITPTAQGESPGVILADRSKDTASAAPSSAARDLTWLDLRSSQVSFGDADITGAGYLRTGHEAFIYTDRGVYRPGEIVHLRAIVRGPDGVMPPAFPVRWQFRRPDLHDWKSIMGQIDSDGAATLDVPLPDDLPTGHWSVSLGLPGHDKQNVEFGSASFSVEDFMPNRMEVGLTLAGAQTKTTAGAEPRFAVGNQPLSAQVHADYLFGKPVAARPAQVVARIDPSTFAPPQWSGWTFGDSASTAQTLEGLQTTGHRTELPQQMLDAHGHATFSLDLATLTTSDATAGKIIRHMRRGKRPAPMAVAANPLAHYVGPWRLTVTASVIETGGRAVSAWSEAQLDPVPWYVGVRSRTSAASIDAPNPFDIVLVAPDGKTFAADTTLDASLYRESWNNSLTFENGHYVYHSTRLLDLVRKSSVKIIAGKAALDVRPTAFGSYVLRLTHPKDGQTTSIGFYAGQGAWEDSVSRENPESLQVVVRPMPRGAAVMTALRNRDPAAALSAMQKLLTTPPAPATLRLGDTAQVIVRSPFAGTLLLSVETDDVIATRVIPMPASSIAVPIMISGACRPNAYVTATVVRSIEPNAAWQTHRAIGTARVVLDNADRKLTVRLSLPSEIRPASSLGVGVQITDASGAPAANAAVTVAAVDEGICQLTGFTTPDPFGYFTRIRALGVSTADLYSQLMPEVARVDKVGAVGGDKDAYDPRHTSPVSARRVKPVSLVSGVLHTDAQGFAHADFSMPRFIGKLRLMAVASAGPSMGSGQGATLVRSPILVQSSWPRFAAPGDSFRVPLVVFNNTPRAGVAQVSLHIEGGPLQIAGVKDAPLLPVPLPPQGQATRWIQVTAGQDAGVSHVVLTAAMGDESYEEDVEIPVRPASPEVSLGGYAVATPARAAEISLPGAMLKGTERLQIKITPWPSLQLPRGLDYLETYPYGCLEQTTSALMPLVYLSDIGKQIAPGVFEKQRVADKVQVGVTRMIGMQTASGGLAMWPGEREAWPWGSVYAAHFIVEAQAAGYAVPEEFRTQLLGYVRNLLNQSSDAPDVIQTQAYACYVLALAGQPPRAAMSRLGEIVNTPRSDGVELPGQARLHLAAAWLAAGRRDLAEGLIPRQLPQPRRSRSLTGSLGSPVRDRAILLSTLLSVEPDHPAIPDLAQRLADAGAHGQWRSTQDTAFAVLALGQYLRHFKPAADYASAQLRLDGTELASVAGHDPLLWEAGQGKAPIPAAGAKASVAITGPADAKAHIAWLAMGVPLTPPPAADHAMRIRRRFLDEGGKPLKVNRVHSGDLVQIELTISSDTPLANLVIDDLLPAGLEIENPRLKTTAADSVDRSTGNRFVNEFADTRLDMRDDRLVLTGNLVGAGTGKYVYTARAVTPGKFMLPPVEVQCMYDTQTSSLWGGGTFDVLPAGAATLATVQD